MQWILNTVIIVSLFGQSMIIRHLWNELEQQKTHSNKWPPTECDLDLPPPPRPEECGAISTFDKYAVFDHAIGITKRKRAI